MKDDPLIRILTVVCFCSVLLAGVLGCVANQHKPSPGEMKMTDKENWSRAMFEGHTYVLYRWGGSNGSESIAHDPDCPCLKKKDNE